MRKYKNIRLRKSPIVIDRVKPINKIIRECLTESFNSIIETEYETKKDGNITIYRFKTNQNNYYDLEFILSFISCETKVGDNILTHYSDGIKITNTCVVPTIDVAFVPTEINLKDRDNHELYTKETNRGEQIELFGRVSFLVKRFIESNKEVDVYVIGKDTKEIKLNIYMNIFDNVFSSDYIKIEGENSGYDNGSYYFIKKMNK